MSINLTKEITKEENALVSINVTIPKEEVAKYLEKNINEHSKKSDIKGFRKGKAPKNIVYKKYKRNIDYDTLDNMLNDSVRKIITEEDLHIYSQPNVTKLDEEIDKNKDFHFSFEIELIPTVGIGDYKDINYKKVTYKYKDEDIENRLKSIQNNETMVVDKEDEPA
ncbi:MAG: trigger factor family protein, partial [bacterium]